VVAWAEKQISCRGPRHDVVGCPRRLSRATKHRQSERVSRAPAACSYGQTG
jgi:hypothetical protein